MPNIRSGFIKQKILQLKILKLYRTVGNHMDAKEPGPDGPVETQRRNNMSRLKAIDPSAATGKAKELLDAVKGKLGIVPNMTKVMATSPVVLESYLGFSGALAGGLLDAKTREELALLTAQENGCDYCLSAHTAIGKMVGLKARRDRCQPPRQWRQSKDDCCVDLREACPGHEGPDQRSRAGRGA
jgi:AhpD family alkylhydroperoxidase